MTNHNLYLLLSCSTDQDKGFLLEDITFTTRNDVSFYGQLSRKIGLTVITRELGDVLNFGTLTSPSDRQ